MYQVEWFNESVYKLDNKNNAVIKRQESKIPVSDIEYALFTHWEEHCLECAPPACYSSCSLYLERKDKKCRNLYYGINKNTSFAGLFPFGAEMTFKKWGKLETEVHNRYGTVEKIVSTEEKNEKVIDVIDALYGPLTLFDKKRKLNGAYTVYKRKKLADIDTQQEQVVFDEFVIECYSFEAAPFRLIVENKLPDPFRTSVYINPGMNLIKIPFSDFKYRNNIPEGTLSVYPENDQESHLVFTWLDFIKYKNAVSQPAKADIKPAAKVKCVAWDLDNTLWKGVFIESNPADLILNKAAVEMIKRLDEMGIIQTALSKNNQEDVLPYLKTLGLDEYFLYPGINWGQKSENLKNIAKNLNINLDTFAVIDDSPFERMEIATALPQVRVYEDTRINELLNLAEFDTPVTEEGKNRRKFYQTEQKRNEISQTFSGDYKSFLKSCDFHLNIFVPQTDEQIKRCYELIQRTNQLNISSKRYSWEEFHDIINDKNLLKYAFDCYDTFGAYGIVGLCIISVNDDNYKITDFVISCRVAQKLVEHSFVYWLGEKMKSLGIRKLFVDYVKTSRNAPILAVFDDLQFEKKDMTNNNFLLFKDVDTIKEEEKVITIHEEK